MQEVPSVNFVCIIKIFVGWVVKRKWRKNCTQKNAKVSLQENQHVVACHFEIYREGDLLVMSVGKQDVKTVRLIWSKKNTIRSQRIVQEVPAGYLTILSVSIRFPFAKTSIDSVFVLWDICPSNKSHRGFWEHQKLARFEVIKLCPREFDFIFPDASYFLKTTENPF